MSLHEERLVPAVKQSLSAAVYTQLSDVEGELNGLLTYDRAFPRSPRTRYGPRSTASE